MILYRAVEYNRRRWILSVNRIIIIEFQRNADRAGKIFSLIFYFMRLCASRVSRTLGVSVYLVSTRRVIPFNLFFLFVPLFVVLVLKHSSRRFQDVSYLQFMGTLSSENAEHALERSWGSASRLNTSHNRDIKGFIKRGRLICSLCSYKLIIFFSSARDISMIW